MKMKMKRDDNPQAPKRTIRQERQFLFFYSLSMDSSLYHLHENVFDVSVGFTRKIS